MILEWIDWLSILIFFVISLAVGIAVARKAGKNAEEFFVSGRSMPWWLLGVSMVATTFSADTPNLVSDMVRQDGISGNWRWWAFLLTGMTTVFIYAKLWRRSKILTDVEFYEIRYSGKTAAFLRGFRALYLGVFFNTIIMATVTLAAIKLGSVVLQISPLTTVIVTSTIVVIYSMLGGLKGVLITDFIQFLIAMAGAVAAAFVAVNLPEIGGLENLFTHEAVKGKLSLFPDFSDTSLALSVFIIPVAVQWWSVWYPGSEPGGGGYIAQRMLAAKDEKNAIGATLFFNIAHYALRPWPWIIVALASLIIFPDLEALKQAFPHIDSSIIKDDLAYPAMLTFMPSGLLGVIIASLIAAVMSTLSTHLNWGASYIVNDFYKRFINSNPSNKAQVRVGRLSILALMILAATVALFLQNALQAFNILLQIGAGTGLLFLLRWFWWRINAASELSAMIISFLVAIYFEFFHTGIFGFAPMEEWQKLITGVAITTIGWIIVTFLTKPVDREVLEKFCHLVKPGGPGWKKFTDDEKKWSLPHDLLLVFSGLVTIYGTLFTTGFWLYGNTTPAIITTLSALCGGVWLIKLWQKRKSMELS